MKIQLKKFSVGQQVVAQVTDTAWYAGTLIAVADNHMTIRFNDGEEVEVSSECFADVYPAAGANRSGAYTEAEAKALIVSKAATKPVTAKAPDMAAFLTLLRIPLDYKQEQDRMKLVQTRINKLGFGQYCSRCGGSGNYSYNPTSGTTCFRCNGSGYEALPAKAFTQELYDKLAHAVENGELDRYLEANKLLRKARNLGYAKQYMDAWSLANKEAAAAYGDGKEYYDWHKAGSEQPHHDLAEQVNKPLALKHQEVSDAENAVSGLLFKLTKAQTPQEKEAVQQQIASAVQTAESVVTDALALIPAKMALIPGILARHADPEQSTTPALEQIDAEIERTRKALSSDGASKTMQPMNSARNRARTLAEKVITLRAAAAQVQGRDKLEFEGFAEAALQEIRDIAEDVKRMGQELVGTSVSGSSAPDVSLSVNSVEIAGAGLREFYDRYGKSTDPELYVNFSNTRDDPIDKSFVSNPDHSDPIGLYAYPLRFVIQEIEKLSTDYYGFDFKFLRVIRKSAKAKSLDVDKLEAKEAAAMIAKLQPYSKDVLNDLFKRAVRRYGKDRVYDHRQFWFDCVQTKNLEEALKVKGAKRLYYSGAEQSKRILGLGVTVLHDNSTDQNDCIINWQEPTQTLFLRRDAFDVVEVLEVAEGREAWDRLTTKVATALFARLGHKFKSFKNGMAVSNLGLGVAARGYSTVNVNLFWEKKAEFASFPENARIGEIVDGLEALVRKIEPHQEQPGYARASHLADALGLTLLNYREDKDGTVAATLENNVYLTVRGDTRIDFYYSENMRNSLTLSVPDLESLVNAVRRFCASNAQDQQFVKRVIERYNAVRGSKPMITSLLLVNVKGQNKFKNLGFRCNVFSPRPFYTKTVPLYADLNSDKTVELVTEWLLKKAKA